MGQNVAYIDAQNLRMGTKSARGGDRSWTLDLRKFRVFLREKYDVKKAYYFVGARDERYDSLYGMIESFGYELVFRSHDKKSMSHKKGNVDTDIVFQVMDDVYRRRISGKVILVSGDGDYSKMIDRLIEGRKLRAIMFPSKCWSSLYNKIADIYKVRLYTEEVRRYLELKDKK